MEAGFVERLAAARIGGTFNQYAASELLRERLSTYLESKADAPIVLVAEAPGYRGTRVSGIPLTSERQLTGSGPAEATATTVHRALAELGLADDILLWNLVPTHPGTETSNRPPTRGEIDAAAPFLAEILCSRRVVAVGRLAQARLGGPYVRHPSHGGASAFRSGLESVLVTSPARAFVPDPVRSWSAHSRRLAAWSSSPSAATRSCSPPR